MEHSQAREAYGRFCFRPDNEAFSGFGGDDKVCVTYGRQEADGKGGTDRIEKINYSFGLAKMSERPEVIDAIQYWLRGKGWEMGARNIVGRICYTVQDLLESIALRDAVLEFYFEHPFVLLDIEGFAWLKQSVKSVYEKKIYEIRLDRDLADGNKVNETAAVLKERLSQKGFVKLESNGIIEEL